MKKILALIMAIAIFVICGCEGKKEETLQKPITGIDAIFDEELGYYNENPCAVKVSETEMYVFYTRNLVKFDNKTDSIAVRKANYKNGEWVYGDFKTVLKLNDDPTAWDHKYISSPDVIKGEFHYEGETYSYLMAYAGSNSSGRQNAQIGLAVSKTIDGEYVRVGNKPLITFSQIDYSEAGLSNYKGAQEPSLISYDKKGKVQLYYSFYGQYNCSYMVEVDCFNLDDIRMGGRMLAETDGLSDQTTNTHLYSADFAYNPSKDEIIAARNYSSKTTGLPSTAEAFQLVYASVSKAYYEVNTERRDSEGSQIWLLCNSRYSRVGAVRTSVDDGDLMKSSGYYRCNNATIISDEYGWVDNPENIEVIFTSSALSNSNYLVKEQYKYSQMLHYYSVPFTRDEE